METEIEIGEGRREKETERELSVRGLLCLPLTFWSLVFI